MTTDALIPYEVVTEIQGGRVHVHVHLPDSEGAVDYHWYMSRDVVEAQDPEHPIFDVEAAAKYFGEEGAGLNRRTVDRITRAINFDVLADNPRQPAPAAAPPPAPDPEPDPEPYE